MEIKINDVLVQCERPIDMGEFKQFRRSEIRPMRTKGPKVKSIRFRRVNFDKDAEKKLKDNTSFLITNPEPLNNKDQKNDDGIFSPKFGYSMIRDNVTPYSCECGRSTSAMEEGELCQYCGHPVQYITADLSKNAYICIKPYRIFSFHGWNMITDWMKKKKITLVPRSEIGITGKRIKDPNKVDMIELMEYFEDHPEEFPLDAGEATMSYIPVINANLRPLILKASRTTVFEINKDLLTIVNDSRNLAVARHNKNRNEITTILHQIQTTVNKINVDMIKLLEGKTGDVRAHFTTCRMDWCSRMVITPGEGLKPDEVDIPYPTLVRFYEEEIVYNLHKMGYSEEQAIDIYMKGQSTITSHMKRAIKMLLKKERWILINRNPTIKYGSILYMKIRSYNKDVKDCTMKIPAAIRPIMNADHDGDQLTGVCNKIAIESDLSSHETLKYAFCPKYMFVDANTGYTNEDMMFTKDHAAIITDMLNLSNLIWEMIIKDPEVILISDRPGINSYKEIINRMIEDCNPSDEVEADIMMDKFEMDLFKEYIEDEEDEEEIMEEEDED